VIMRRFSRRRRGGAADVAINGATVFAQILEQNILDLASLEAMAEDAVPDVPNSYAVLANGEDKNGGKVIVSYAPRHAGDALLGGLIVASKLAEAETEPFSGELIVVAPEWSLSARRRLSLVQPSAYRLRAVAAPSLADTSLAVSPVPVSEPGVVSVAAVKSRLTSPADQDLFARAVAALDGLASKHGGAIRGFEQSVELVVMARRVAELRADESGVMLNTILPSRSSVRLSGDTLAGVLDALEGNLRKRLNDRRTREGDEGVRTRLIPLVAEALSLRSLVSWPVGGKDLDVIDSVGVNADGSPVATASRSSLSLAALGVILDAALDIRAALPLVLAKAEAPVRLDRFRLALIAKDFAPGVAKLLPMFNVSHDIVEIRSSGRDKGLAVAICASGEAVPISSGRGRRNNRGAGGNDRARRGGQGNDRNGNDGDEKVASADSALAEAQGGEAEKNEGDGRGRGRSRRRGGRRSRSGDRDSNESGPDAASDENSTAGNASDKSAKAKPRFEEMSSFDLAEEQREDDGEGSKPRGRGRRPRGRRRGGNGGQADAEEDTDRPQASKNRRVESDDAAASADSDDVVDDDDGSLEGALSQLPEELNDDNDVELPQYEEDNDDDGADDAVRNEREKRRRQRQKKSIEEAPPEPPKPVRRRVAIVAHADRDSVLAAVLLARELRLVDGIWVYTQAELMSFFRGGATDLREETPIYVVGFTPSPARDVIQAAAIYAGRLTWIDHREWPPEDLGALKESLGEEQVWVAPGLGSCLPLMIEAFTRRSRFSDKLVDLAAGRFTEHDYERWGRVWWTRLDEIAHQSGSAMSALEPLLAGRPSDLAKEAELAELPPPPPEVEFVSNQDFRLVHFAGHRMVVLDVPAELDLNLAARIARERYVATLSLAVQADGEMIIVSGEEGVGRRTLDFGGLVSHLADKLEWVKSLPDHDHVTRFLIKGRVANPERLDEVIGEIVMGRSLLER
jgi:hypothetical protein